MLHTTSLVAFTLANMLCWVGQTQAGKGQIGAINGPDDWCMFLPPKAGGGIAPHEVDAIAFCNRKQPNAPGAKLFPKGFIRSSHFVKTKTYVQITGQFDRKAYYLSKNDSGGQYDMQAPVGASIAGFKRFVNMVEPDIEIYCIRACIEKDKVLCDTYHSERGCHALLPGNYGLNTPKAANGSCKAHRKLNRTIVEQQDLEIGNKDMSLPKPLPSAVQPTARPTQVVDSDSLPTQSVTLIETKTKTKTETKTKTKTKTKTITSLETTTYTVQTTSTVTKILPPLPTDIANFPSLPKPESPTVLIRNSSPDHEPRPAVITSAVSGCRDLYPDGLLNWNTTVSTAIVFIPGNMAVRFEFFVQENCTGLSVYNLERDTLSTHRSSIVDVLPDFFGNYLGPQSVTVRVEG